jgi:AcrR family transcriptional regulator
MQTGDVVTRKEQAAQSKALLVQTALQLFVEQGYEATSLSQILEHANMARGALYHHFPDGKKGLFLEVVELVDHDLHEGFDTILRTVQSPTAMILAGFDLLLKLAANRNFARIILIEAATVMPGAWANGSEFNLLRECLKRAVTAGELRELPLDATTVSLYGAARRSADFVAQASNPRRAARDSSKVLTAMIDGLRI